jgi:methanogenic corrinoid protein MtbC1
MSGHVVLDRQRLEVAFSEIDVIRKTLPDSALTALAQEVVKRVADNLNVTLPLAVMPSEAEIDALCTALSSPDAGAAITLIEEAQRKGAGYESLYRFYLAEASQRLGTWWDEDKVSFYSVTIAAGRIYAILRILRLQKHLPTPDLQRAAMFASVPGENHTLGIAIAADLARDRGWDVELFLGHGHEELVEVMSKRDTQLIGLSASTRRSLPALMKLIVALRISKPKAKILVCGPIATSDYGFDGVTRADAAASDFDTALALMETLVAGDEVSAT